MFITFHGVRGSIAVSGSEFHRTGGNTTCVEVREGAHTLILDAGTGLRGLGQRLVRQGPVEATFLFSHMHWDHIQGFPFFAPAFVPSTKLALYGPRHDDGTSTLEDVLREQMKAPAFPVPLSAMGSQKTFHTLASGDAIEIGPFTVKTRALCHPQGSFGYRIEAGGKAFCFATDTEHPADGTVDEALRALAEGADLLAYDAQYTEAEYPNRRGWGHSTWVEATKAARAASVGSLALIHHDPTRGDEGVDAIEAEARTAFGATRAAREGMTVEL